MQYRGSSSGGGRVWGRVQRQKKDSREYTGGSRKDNGEGSDVVVGGEDDDEMCWEEVVGKRDTRRRRMERIGNRSRDWKVEEEELFS